MRNSLALLLLVLLVPLPASAQDDAECTVPKGATRLLDVNRVSAPLSATRPLFVNGGYAVPIADDLAMSCLLTPMIGERNGEMLGGAAFFIPGPAESAEPETCNPYDRVWMVDRIAIRGLERGVITTDIRDWPWQLGAPVTDGDGVQGNYNLEGGDQPTLFGDQTAWWIMHDKPDDSLSVEIQVTAFAFAGAGNLGNTTFFRYRIVNAADEPLTKFQLALSPEVELGGAHSNWAGSRPDLDLTYHYRAEVRSDGGPESTYASSPPALGLAFLPSDLWPDGSALAADGDVSSGLHAFVLNDRYSWSGESLSRAFSGLRHDGSLIRRGKDGATLRGEPTRYMFDGSPVSGTGWTMVDTDGQGRPFADRPSGGEWVTYGASTPVDLPPRGQTEVVFMVTLSQSDTPLAAVGQLFDWVARVRDSASYLLAPTVEIAVQPESFDLAASRPFPNPFTRAATIEYEVQQDASVEFALFDLLGRRVRAQPPVPRVPGRYSLTFSGEGLAPGTYMYRFQIGRVASSGAVVYGGQ